MGLTADPTASLPRIVDLETTALAAPLVRPWATDVTHNHVVTVRVTASDGSEGFGFAWTPRIGARAVRAVIENDVRPAVIGRTAHPVTVSRMLFAHLHEGGAGIVGMAAAAIDLALWDRQATQAGLGLADHLGRERDSAPVYGSGVNLHYSEQELVQQAERWVAAGFTGVKVKVGKPDLGEDIDRLRAVREVIGPRRRLMVDANQRWDLASAIRAVRAFDGIGIDWIEEPLRADDTAGYLLLRSRIDVPVAMGENAHTVQRFRDLIGAGACDIVQPNVIRVGGITPFLTISAIAEASSIAVAPHLLPDVSAQLALTLPRESWVEGIEDADLGSLNLLAEPSPLRIENGRATLLPRRGLGLRFRRPTGDEDAALPVSTPGSVR